HAPGVVGLGAAAATGPQHVAVGVVLDDEDVGGAGAGEDGAAERGDPVEGAGDVGGAVGAQRDARAVLAVDAAAAPRPEHVARRGVLDDEDVGGAAAGEAERAERGRPLELAGDVGVAGGVHRDALGLVAAVAAAVARPQHRALGVVLDDEGVEGAVAGEDGAAERGRAVEAAGDVGVAGGVHRDAGAVVAVDAGAAAA